MGNRAHIIRMTFRFTEKSSLLSHMIFVKSRHIANIKNVIENPA